MSATNLKNVTVQLTPDLLALVDAEADKLDLNRSQYFRRLVRKELQTPGDTTTPVQPTQPIQEAA